MRRDVEAMKRELPLVFLPPMHRDDINAIER
jgi:hypothetical protein